MKHYIKFLNLSKIRCWCFSVFRGAWIWYTFPHALRWKLLWLSVCHCLLCIAVCSHFHSGLTNIKWIIHVHYLALRGFRWSKCLHDMSENYCTSSLQRCSLKQPEELVLAPILAILLYSAAYSVFSIEVFCILMCLSATVKDAGYKDEEKKKTYCKDAVNVCLHKSWNAYICECSAGGKCYIKRNRFIRASPRGFCVVAVNIFLLSILSSMARNCRGQVKSWASRSLVHASYLCRCRKNRACYIAKLHTVWILTYGF